LREVRAGGDKKPISGFVLGDGFGFEVTLRTVGRPSPLLGAPPPLASIYTP
jgi:hypothetical protein